MSGEPGNERDSDADMGGTGWDGVPAGTSGSGAPGTEATEHERVSSLPEGERPPRRGHEDVGDASGELGMVGKADPSARGQRAPTPRDEADPDRDD